MHFTSILLAPLTVATLALAAPAPAPAADAATNTTPNLGIEKRACFGSGEVWGGDRSNAITKAVSFCTLLNNANVGAGQVLHVCQNLSTLKKVDFTVQNIGGANRRLPYAECYDGLQKEINSCDRGGATSYTNWRYTADPNAGNCA